MVFLRRLSLPIAILVMVSVCPASGQERANPLLSKSSLGFHAPEFDKIRDADFKPAIEAGIAEQRAEIWRIANNPEPPTFENTIDALERAGQLLTRVQLTFNGLTSANTNDGLQKVQEEEAPRLAALQSETFLDEKLFKRVEAIYGRRAQLKLSQEAHRLVEWYHQHFILAGAKLSPADKATFAKLTEEDATLSAKFTNQLLAAAKAGALVVDNVSALAGLTPAAIEAAAQAAKERGLEGKWLIPLQNTTQQPALASLENRETRRQLFQASWTRAGKGDANDTRATIARQAQLRAQQAALLGFPSYAAWKLQDQMAKAPQAWTIPRQARAGRDRPRAQQGGGPAEGDRLAAGGFTLEPSDWNQCAEQIRKARYDVDESQIKPYFELNACSPTACSSRRTSSTV